MLPFLPILVIYSAFLPAYFEDLYCLNFRALHINLFYIRIQSFRSYPFSCNYCTIHIYKHSHTSIKHTHIHTFYCQTFANIFIHITYIYKYIYLFNYLFVHTFKFVYVFTFIKNIHKFIISYTFSEYNSYIHSFVGPFIILYGVINDFESIFSQT